VALVRSTLVYLDKGCERDSDCDEWNPNTCTRPYEEQHYTGKHEHDCRHKQVAVCRRREPRPPSATFGVAYVQVYDESPVMLELDLKLTAPQVLDECRRRGIVTRSERELAGRTSSHQWHLRMPGRPGTLELNEWQNRVWVKVHPLRDGGWATALAHELAAQQSE
jgi:hypothetical protein